MHKYSVKLKCRAHLRSICSSEIRFSEILVVRCAIWCPRVFEHINPEANCSCIKHIDSTLSQTLDSISEHDIPVHFAFDVYSTTIYISRKYICWIRKFNVFSADALIQFSTFACRARARTVADSTFSQPRPILLASLRSLFSLSFDSCSHLSVYVFDNKRDCFVE